VGDAGLVPEKSLGFDLTLRRSSGTIRGSASAFVNSFTDYIHQEFTGGEEDGLPVLRYAQGDARFSGLELETHIGLVDSGSRHLDLVGSLDFVRARLDAGRQPLPRTPPLRIALGLEFHDDRWIAAFEMRGSDPQRRLAPGEIETPGYTLVNAHVGYRFFRGRTVTDILLRGSNLGDAEARNHVSYLKDLLPLPGRDVRLSIRTRF
jgi:iron complex outermembrane receptor protein